MSRTSNVNHQEKFFFSPERLPTKTNFFHPKIPLPFAYLVKRKISLIFMLFATFEMIIP
jgi:hypothetical protein